MTLGEQIIEYRAKHNMSQRDFAQKCKLSVQTVCSIETGHQEAGKMTKKKIELVLNEED